MCGKVENSGSMEHFVKEFWLRESFESCRNMGKNLFVAEGYSLIDEERREGGTKNRSKWNLKTLLAERSTKERNKRAKDRFARTPSKGPITVHYVSVLVEKSDIKPNCNTLPYFYRIKTPF